jgi:competence protein ComEC
MFQVKKKIITRRDSFLWCLPILLLLGFLAMKSQLERPELYEAFDQETPCKLRGSITMIVEKPWGRAIYVKNNEVSLEGGTTYLCENVIVYRMDTPDNNDHSDNSLIINYLVGNQITVSGTLQKFSVATNPGQFNEQLYYQIENIDFKMLADQIMVSDSGYSRYHALLGLVKDKLIAIYDIMLEEKESGALIAMLLGEKYLLDEEIKQLYQENGISHVLAISGLHVSLIGMFVFELLKKLKFPITLATIFSIIFIYSYGVLTNFSVSTNRAVVMMIILLLSTLPGKTYDMLTAMALSALIILLQNPLQVLSAGFLLSYGAVIGIAIILPCLQSLYPTKNLLINSLFISLSAQITTLPQVVYFYYQFPLYGIITNLIILPLVTILTLTSILAGIIGAIYMPAGIFLIGGANYILKFYEWICRVGNRIPGNLVTAGKPSQLQLLLYLVIVTVFVLVATRYGKKYSVLILSLAFFILILPRRNVGLEITMLDVGQGEAIYIETESGTTYLIDGGSSDVKKLGMYRLSPFLRSKGTDRIDYAIITHSDNDHISGLKEMIEQEQIKITKLILPYIKVKDKAYIELEALARENNIALQYISFGDLLQDGSIRMLCLHPSIDYETSSANGYSTVLSISYGEFDMLLTGDLEKDGEELLIELLQNTENQGEFVFDPAIDYDILKVAHHGSKNSTYKEFLDLIRPELSIISCGKDNSYGHPHQELLDRLKSVGSDVRTTSEGGAVTIRTDGRRLEITDYRND